VDRSFRFPIRVGARGAACAAALALLAACGDGDIAGSGGGGGGGTDAAVVVGNNFFNPNASTVTVGTTITWTWAANAVIHNVTFSDGPASTTKSSGTYQRRFDVAGSYPYVCTVHGSTMSGTVTVNP
jgi:plastocyanin